MRQWQHVQYATTFSLFDFTLSSRKSQTKWNPVSAYNCSCDANNNINMQRAKNRTEIRKRHYQVLLSSCLIQLYYNSVHKIIQKDALEMMGCDMFQLVGYQPLTLQACLIPGQLMWNLGWKKCHWDRFFSECFYFPVSNIPPVLHIDISLSISNTTWGPRWCSG